MDDDQILARGGDEHDIEEYAKANGADLTKEDVLRRTVHMMVVAEEDLRIGDIVTITMNEDGTDVRARKSLPTDPKQLNK